MDSEDKDLKGSSLKASQKLDHQQASANELLHRKAPSGYMGEWEDFLGRPKEASTAEHMQATVIFRICDEYLAIATAVVGQVTELKPLHHVPHQRNKIIQGCVNINGRLRLFMSMIELLEIGNENALFEPSQKRSMMVIEKEGEVWAFAVTEVCGVHQCDMRQLKNVPVNVAKSTANYLKGVFQWNSRSIGYLDDELLFFSLRKSLL